MLVPTLDLGIAIAHLLSNGIDAIVLHCGCFVGLKNGGPIARPGDRLRITDWGLKCQKHLDMQVSYRAEEKRLADRHKRRYERAAVMLEMGWNRERIEREALIEPWAFDAIVLNRSEGIRAWRDMEMDQLTHLGRALRSAASEIGRAVGGGMK